MRAGKSITVSLADRRGLENLIDDRNVAQKYVWRAEIVLFTADGAGTNEIMRRTCKSKTCVWRWQERFLEEGFEGLASRQDSALADQAARWRGGRAGCRPDAWRSTRRNDPLDRRLDGEGVGPQC